MSLQTWYTNTKVTSEQEGFLYTWQQFFRDTFPRHEYKDIQLKQLWVTYSILASITIPTWPKSASLPSDGIRCIQGSWLTSWLAATYLCSLTWKNALGLNFRLPKCHYLKWKSFIRHSTNFSRLYITYLGCGEEMRHTWIVPAHPPFQVWSPLSLASYLSRLWPPSFSHPHHCHCRTAPSPPIYSVVLTNSPILSSSITEGQRPSVRLATLVLSGGAWIKAPKRTSVFMARLKFTSPGELVLTESWDSEFPSFTLIAGKLSHTFLKWEKFSSAQSSPVYHLPLAL